jgi:anti-anti-sigma factor
VGAGSNVIPEKFAVTSRRSGGLLIIAVAGELDIGNVELLDQPIHEAEQGDAETIFLDLRELSFVDSVVSLLCEARRRSDRIRFVPSDHPAVTRIVAVSGTDEILGYPTELEPPDGPEKV